MNAEKESVDWRNYHNTSTRQVNSRTWAVADVVGLPFPPLADVERILAGLTAPTDKAGKKLGWNFNAHLGCTKPQCEYAHEQYKNPPLLSYPMQLVMVKRDGARRAHKIQNEMVSDAMKEIRRLAASDRKSEMNPAKTR